MGLSNICGILWMPQVMAILMEQVTNHEIWVSTDFRQGHWNTTKTRFHSGCIRHRWKSVGQMVGLSTPNIQFPKWLMFGLVLGNPWEILNGKGRLRNTQTHLMVVNRTFQPGVGMRLREPGWLCWTHVISIYWLLPSLLWNIDQALTLSSFLVEEC